MTTVNHAKGVLLWRDLLEIAEKVCGHYGLTFAKMEPETRRRKTWYGECIECDRCHTNEHVNKGRCSEKIIKIRIHQLNRRNRPLAMSVIMDTLAHELAHLDPKTWRHGVAHRAKTQEILAFIRELGYDW